MFIICQQITQQFDSFKSLPVPVDV